MTASLRWAAIHCWLCDWSVLCARPPIENCLCVRYLNSPRHEDWGPCLLKLSARCYLPSFRAAVLDSLGHPTLSWGQERLWTLDQMDGGSSQYNMPLALELFGPLDVHYLVGGNSGLSPYVMQHCGQ